MLYRQHCHSHCRTYHCIMYCHTVVNWRCYADSSMHNDRLSCRRMWRVLSYGKIRWMKVGNWMLGYWICDDLIKYLKMLKDGKTQLSSEDKAYVEELISVLEDEQYCIEDEWIFRKESIVKLIKNYFLIFCLLLFVAGVMLTPLGGFGLCGSISETVMLVGVGLGISSFVLPAIYEMICIICSIFKNEWIIQKGN